MFYRDIQIWQLSPGVSLLSTMFRIIFNFLFVIRFGNVTLMLHWVRFIWISCVR